MKKLSIIISVLVLAVNHSLFFGMPLQDKKDIAGEVVDQGKVFIENKGQWDDEVRFLTKTGGMNAWITDGGIVFDFYRIERNEEGFEKFPGRDRHGMSAGPEEVRRHGHVVKMNFISPQQDESVFCPYDQKTTYYNYFIGSDTTRWARFVPLYGEVIAERLYEGIDIRYYYEPGGLRYDFIVHPGRV